MTHPDVELLRAVVDALKAIRNAELGDIKGERTAWHPDDPWTPVDAALARAQHWLACVDSTAMPLLSEVLAA